MNPENASICHECGFSYEKQILPEKTSNGTIFSKKFSQQISESINKQLSTNIINDIMVVFDCTGSMLGEIQAMRDSVIEFANAIMAAGIDIRIGLIEFRDRLVNQEHKLHNFPDGVFTKHFELYKESIAGLKATGGGNNKGESSLDAIMLALEQPFRDGPNKTLILITDEPPHVPDKSTKTIREVIDKLDKIKVSQFYVVTVLTNKRCLKHIELLEGVQKYGGDGLALEIVDKESERGPQFSKVLHILQDSISTKSISI
jgi:hypothetical protein